MDVKKLKIEKFKNIQIKNFPTDIDFSIESTNQNVEVIIYYIDQLEDIDKEFISFMREAYVLGSQQ